MTALLNSMSLEDLRSGLKDLEKIKKDLNTKGYQKEWDERIAKEKADGTEISLPLKFFQDTVEGHIITCKARIAELEDINDRYN